MRAGPSARTRRKADLVSASALLRLHAAAAVDGVAQRADTASLQLGRLRRVLARPSVRLAGVALLVLLASRRLLRPRPPAPDPARASAVRPAARLLDWAPVAWRLWRAVSPAVKRWLDAGAVRRR